MSKLLQTQLPLAQSEVTPDTFNRLIRLLEINLGAVDLDNTRQVSENELNTINLKSGIILLAKANFSPSSKSKSLLSINTPVIGEPSSLKPISC